MAGGIDVVALGGNALIPSDGSGTIEQQRSVTAHSMEQVADLIASGRRIIVTHGNGPIVGNILERNEAAKDRIPPMPLDVCGADSQGGIGYMIQQILGNVLRARGIDAPTVSIVSQVVVSASDDAFERPTKPIGPFYTPEEARALRSEKGWIMKEDPAGKGMRRVVPSPTPIEIVEAVIISRLLSQGVVVIAVGGGGIPVVRSNGMLTGVEAVIDKDRAASVLAANIGAERLIILTDIDRVYVKFGTPEQKPLERATLSEIRALYEAYEFPAGSMGPKIRASIDFLGGGGSEAIIAHASQLREACQSDAGTHIVPDGA
ncbi:MAG: carbamate kinase [Candidatus Krumholzibacteria bacterium]|nr:carbamate kinase [Candidatus Krumholzibacteria bacterium]